MINRDKVIHASNLLQGSSKDENRIKALGSDWFKKYHLFDHFRNGHTNGFLDAGSGITIANKVRSKHLSQYLPLTRHRHVYMRGTCAKNLV